MNAWRTGTGMAERGSTVPASTRVRTRGRRHHGAGAGSATGTEPETIALQRSDAARRLPAPPPALTIPRHDRSAARTRVARVRAPRHRRARRAPRRRAADGVLRLRSHGAEPAARQPHADHAARALPARWPQA